MVFQPLPSSQRLLDTVPVNLTPEVDEEAEENAFKAISVALERAQAPCLLVDGLVSRVGARRQAKELAYILAIPTYTTIMGKSIIDEDRSFYQGVYNGQVSYPGIKSAVESSDLVLNLGCFPSDSNTGGHTRKIRDDQLILIQPDHVQVRT